VSQGYDGWPLLLIACIFKGEEPLCIFNKLPLRGPREINF